MFYILENLFRFIISMWKNSNHDCNNTIKILITISSNFALIIKMCSKNKIKEKTDGLYLIILLLS
jgi:hypothetical protein